MPNIFFVFIISLINSLKIYREAYYSFHIVPDSFTLIQYYEVFLRSPEFLLKFWNSIILTLPIVIGQIVISLLGACAFAKIKFSFNKPIFFMFIILMLMPYQVTLVPIYITNDAKNTAVGDKVNIIASSSDDNNSAKELTAQVLQKQYNDQTNQYEFSASMIFYTCHYSFIF